MCFRIHPRFRIVFRFDRVVNLLLRHQFLRPDLFFGFQIVARQRAAMQKNNLILADELRAAEIARGRCLQTARKNKYAARNQTTHTRSTRPSAKTMTVPITPMIRPVLRQNCASTTSLRPA